MGSVRANGTRPRYDPARVVEATQGPGGWHPQASRKESDRTKAEGKEVSHAFVAFLLLGGGECVHVFLYVVFVLLF